MVVTRFAPSPTGFLHIGGARTALFNYLYAKRNGGQFLLRVEDTDKARSTDEATQAILDGMAWLGLTHDGEVVYQSKQEARHREVAEQLLADGKAYKCFCSQEELAAMREAGHGYDRRWRDNNDHPDAPYTIRIKAPLEGAVVIKDDVQGDVTSPAKELDDFILLRADGTPTYMLAVVVDDHDMGITHVIRGDDHLNNAARQSVIYTAMGWDIPNWAHIPLIHGNDGAKLSKRHGALGVDAYRDMGYLPEGIRNYLALLGWSHGDQEFFTDAEMIALFDSKDVNKAASRFDFDKLNHINAHHLQAADNNRIFSLLGLECSDAQSQMIRAALPSLKERSQTVKDVAALAEQVFMTSRPVAIEEKAQGKVDDLKPHLPALISAFEALEQWNGDTIKAAFIAMAEAAEVKFGKLMPGLRGGVTGMAGGPDLMEILTILGKDEVVARLQDLL